MSLRISSVGLFLLVAACGGPPETAAPGNAQDIGSGTPAEVPVERIACAVGGADFAEVCTVDRAAMTGGSLLTIRQPDGGFHRLRLSADGLSVTAADGALPAEILVRDARGTEVAIGDARYRLPPTR
ncbi:MAG: hypothetical protein V4537_11070 [Pseudomonadota bacterium]